MLNRIHGKTRLITSSTIAKAFHQHRHFCCGKAPVYVVVKYFFYKGQEMLFFFKL